MFVLIIFFQKCVGYGASDKSFINKELIKVSRKAFFEVIIILIPDIVIVWGKSDMWTWMPPFDFEEGKMLSKNLYIYNKYKDSIIFHIEHPSSPTFDIIKNTKFIKEQFEEIKRLSGKTINIPIN